MVGAGEVTEGDGAARASGERAWDTHVTLGVPEGVQLCVALVAHLDAAAGLASELLRVRAAFLTEGVGDFHSEVNSDGVRRLDIANGADDGLGPGLTDGGVGLDGEGSGV
jgi:hypothetical protein